MTLASVAVWIVTALLGATLLLRSGAVNRGPRGRSRRRRVLLTIHVASAFCGLLAWTSFVVTGWWGGAAVTVVLLVVAASHGLFMVARWSPGYGRHATSVRPNRSAGGYFPVHVAAVHAMAASATLTMVVVMLLMARDQW